MRSDASLRELAFEAYSSALDDADIDSSKIDGSVVCSATHYDKQRSPAGVVAEYLGLDPGTNGQSRRRHVGIPLRHNNARILRNVRDRPYGKVRNHRGTNGASH